MKKETKKVYRRRNSKSKVWLSVLSLVGLLTLAGGSFYVLHMKSSFGLSIGEIYQNLANPYGRYIKITPGMRREEVADRFAKTLGWSDAERNKLLNTHTIAMNSSEGYYYPDTYIVPVGAKAADVSQKISETFNKQVIQKHQELKQNIINTETAIKIASIIEREAGKNDKKLVSGVIWNRLFRGMSLDMDATLQYAKGNEELWWPRVKSEDKYIDSPFNTYKNKGLPPSAISNPGPASIDAALNPANTKAIFYFHDDWGRIHTSETYEQHKQKIEMYL
ncbi:MAG: endolytic transglycosylase MltG [bacterium]|nr:endolytic transglycosylase MltG [bacterium]